MGALVYIAQAARDEDFLRKLIARKDSKKTEERRMYGCDSRGVGSNSSDRKKSDMVSQVRGRRVRTDDEATHEGSGDRPRLEASGSLSAREGTPQMDSVAPMNALAETLGRLLPLVQMWLEKQVGQLEPATEARQMLTPKEASPLLNLHVQTVMAWCREGKLDAVKIGGNEFNGKGGKYLIPREAIDAYLHKHRVIHGQRRRNAK